MTDYARVLFDLTCPAFPSGLSPDGWKIDLADSTGASYWFDSSGTIHLKPAGSDHYHISNDATGSLIVFSRECDGAFYHEYLVTVHSGTLVAVDKLIQTPSLNGFYFPPTWQFLPSMQAGVPAAVSFPYTHDFTDLIASAYRDPRLVVEDQSANLMLALALCQPARLGEVDPKQAWRRLSLAQRNAINAWVQS